MVVLKEELPQFLSNWRTVPRLMMVLYGLVFYETMTWFMHLKHLIMHRLNVFISCRWGQKGLSWFGLYVNEKSSKIQKK